MSSRMKFDSTKYHPHQQQIHPPPQLLSTHLLYCQLMIIQEQFAMETLQHLNLTLQFGYLYEEQVKENRTGMTTQRDNEKGRQKGYELKRNPARQKTLVAIVPRTVRAIWWTCVALHTKVASFLICGGSFVEFVLATFAPLVRPLDPKTWLNWNTENRPHHILITLPSWPRPRFPLDSILPPA